MSTKVIKVTSRDKALLIALPSLAVFIGYTLAYAKPPILRLRALTTQVELTRAKVPKPNEIPEAEARVASLQREIQLAELHVQQLRSHMSRIAVTGANNHERLVGVEDLSALWKRKGLILLEQREIDEGSSIMPVPIQTLVAKAQRLGRSRLPKLWELRLKGSFLELREALEELAASEIPAIPISMEMAESIGAPVKSWTLRLWQ